MCYTIKNWIKKSMGFLSSEMVIAAAHENSPLKRTDTTCHWNRDFNSSLITHQQSKPLSHSQKFSVIHKSRTSQF